MKDCDCEYIEMGRRGFDCEYIVLQSACGGLREVQTAKATLLTSPGLAGTSCSRRYCCSSSTSSRRRYCSSCSSSSLDCSTSSSRRYCSSSSSRWNCSSSSSKMYCSSSRQRSQEGPWGEQARELSSPKNQAKRSDQMRLSKDGLGQIPPVVSRKIQAQISP